MTRYIVKRMGYSLLILLGVLILTFVMFRMTAGDPAETMLGKNPSPEELESLRDMLGCDKPLFWGNWKRTERFTGADFREARTEFRGITLRGVTGRGHGAEIPSGGEIEFQSNFPVGSSALKVEIETTGVLLLNGETCVPSGSLIVKEYADPPPFLSLSVAEKTATVKQVRFYKPTAHLFDSQALASLRELVDVRRAFPYVTFFNFGVTLQTREPIRERLWRGIWPSLFLMVPIFVGELFFGIVLAMASCAYRGTTTDRVILLFSVAGMSISYLSMIIFGQWFLAYYLNLFPVWGWGAPKYLALPVILGIVSGTGAGVRFYRTVFLEQMGREYLRTARSKGVTPLRVYFVHMFRNSLVPIVTRASTVLPFLFTGSLLLESFFGIPGLGYEGINALNDSDLQMLKALVILGAMLFIGINLITDVLYRWIDPRMRLVREG